MSEAGLNVVGAVEFDKAASRTFRANHPQVKLWEQDIRTLPATEVMRSLNLRKRELHVLKACPPCQGFSSLAEGRISPDDPRNELVRETLRFVRAMLPTHVMVENVPGLARDARSAELKHALKRLGYSVRDYIVDAQNFRVPQRRRRYILLATRGSNRPMPDSLGDTAAPRETVRQAFESISHDVDEFDSLMSVATTSSIVQSRIDAIPVGGNRFDLPEHLQLECHRRLKSPRDASGAYGRMRWEEPAPTMTTRCTTPSCGPFIHPEENRAITLREAASLQTFPHTYKFLGTRGVIERQIGNAVPVRMAKEIITALLGTASVGASHARPN